MKKSKSFKKGMAVKHYADGEYVDDEPQFKVTPEMMEKSKADLSASSENEPSSATTRSMQGASSEGAEKAVSEKKPEFKSFKEAYAWNKKNNGQGSTFDWQGKKIKVQDAVTPKEVKTSSGPSSWAEIEKNAPSGTSDAAMRAIRANAKNELNKLADLEKGTSRGQKSLVAAPKITENKSSRKPYAPGSVDNSYSGSKFASGGMVHSYKAKSHGKC